MKLNAHATIINDFPGPVIIIFKDSAFEGGKFDFNEVFPHEAIHASGVGKEYAWYQYIFPFYGHSLTGFQGYDNIIKNCASERE